MEKNINLDNIKKFDEVYKSDSNNKIIENAIKNVGINKFCLNNDVINKTYNVFNIELPKSKIYDQVDSERCWIHAGVNLIKNNVAKNLNIEESAYALSVNFLAFLDLNPKSCSSIFGVTLSSLTSKVFCFFFASFSLFACSNLYLP